MIDARELRFGNTILYKHEGRIKQVACSGVHFGLLESGSAKDFFPVALKAEMLQQCGFIENKKYALLPQAREFSLTLPVSGGGLNQLLAWVKANGECFGRATVNGIPGSNNFHHLHTLQNLFYALTGEEMQQK